jgi:hypothetical protein
VGLLIDRLPVPAAERLVPLPSGESILIKSLQPVVWVSVAPPQVMDLPANALRFPAVIDTGFNQTLLIQDGHLESWAGVKLSDLQVYPGESARHGNQIWPFRIADIWLHKHGPDGLTERDPPFCLETHPGILVVAESQRRQRLPVLGMRSLAWNRLRLRLDFEGPTMGLLSLAAP